MRTNPKPQEMYRHFKGNIYQIRCLAKHSETGEVMVVYQAMYDTFQIYVRSLAMFMEEVDHDKYPEAKQKYRFELLQDMELYSSMTSEAYDHAGAEPSKYVEEVTSPQSHEKSADMAYSRTSPQEEAASKPEDMVQGGSTSRVETTQQTAESDEQVHIDPLVMEFLDADTYEQKLNILAALRHRITDGMINTMAAAVDLEIKDGKVEERCDELRNCLLMFEKYECNRLR